MAHKILVIDDERTTIALIKFGLAEARYEIITAGDGMEGLEKFKSEEPDLVVLDVQMPNMNGFEFISEIKQIQGVKITPVIVLTSNETMEDVFKLEGVKKYFVKPVDMTGLVASIKETLGENPL